MNEKHQQNIYNADINVNLMEENVIQIKGGSTTKVDVSAKVQENIICAIKMIFVVQVHVLVKMANTWKILLTIQSISVMKLLTPYGQSQQNMWQLQQERNPKMDNVNNLFYFCISIFYYVLLHF